MTENREILRCSKVGLHSMFDVNFTLHSGECLLILGLRGNYLHELAGIIAGCSQSYNGAILLDGSPICFHSQSEANSAGIYLIQDTSALIGNFSLSENIFLSPRMGKAPFWRGISVLNQQADQLFQELDIPLRGSMLGGDCSIFEQHLTLVAQAVYRNARIIIFENIFSTYTDSQLPRFRQLLQTLRSIGISVLIFSNVVTDLYECADRALIFRSATIVHIFEREQLSRNLLFRAMTQASKAPHHGSTGQQTFLMELINFRPEATTDKPVNCSIERGCVTTLVTENISGAKKLAESVFGSHPFQGTLKLDGSPRYFRNSLEAIDSGIGLITEEIDDNLFRNFDASENIALMLGKQTDFTSNIENRRVSRFLSRQVAKKYEIDPSLLQVSAIRELSNIDKLRLALLRWLVLNPKVLLLVHPYCNLDEGERVEFNQLLDRITSKNIGVLLLSPMIDELSDITDRMVRLP